MANPVIMGSPCKCIFGTVPAPIGAISQKSTLVMSTPCSTVRDTAFMTFGMCSCPNNPAVIAATAAALGVFTPAPCVPVTPGPWVTGALTVMIEGINVLDNNGVLTCAYGGVITVVQTPAVTVEVP